MKKLHTYWLGIAFAFATSFITENIQARDVVITASVSPGAFRDGYSERNGNTIKYYFSCPNNQGSKLNFWLMVTLEDYPENMLTRFRFLDHSHARFVEKINEDPIRSLVSNLAQTISKLAQQYDVSKGELAL